MPAIETRELTKVYRTYKKVPVGLGDPFQVTCESIEALRVISDDKLLFGCDNNFPNTGRNPTLADDSEFIVVTVPDLGGRHHHDRR